MNSVLFRTMLNQCRTVYRYDHVSREDGSRGFSAAELESGAISLCQAFDGKYVDLKGKGKRPKVNGDFAKVKYVKGLNEAGRRLLQNLGHASRQLKGTVGIRKLIGYHANAGRVVRGTSLFITFSPNEKHNVLMLHLHRSRQQNPIHILEKANQKFGSDCNLR